MIRFDEEVTSLSNLSFYLYFIDIFNYSHIIIVDVYHLT